MRTVSVNKSRYEFGFGSTALYVDITYKRYHFAENIFNHKQESL